MIKTRPLFASHSPVPELAHIGFQRFLPQENLRPWIQCYWVAQRYNLPTGGVTETLYPDGGTSLIFNFTDIELPNINFRAGQTASKILFQQNLDCLGVRFNPGGAFKLFGIDMSDLTKSAQQQLFFAAHVADLQPQLNELATTAARLILVENWLVAKARQQQLGQGFFERFVSHFLHTDENFELLVEQTPLSRRQLERKFQQEIGLSPAHLKQLHRVKKAREIITTNPALQLSQVAQDCGFYDQAHFIRHFQKITGQTPGQYKQRKMSQIYNPRP